MESIHHRVGIAACVLTILAGCSGPSSYERVFERTAQPNVRGYPAGQAECRQALSRAVLQLGFAVEPAGSDERLRAGRQFQDGKRTTTITVEATLQAQDEANTLIYLTATESRERLFLQSHRRFFLWIIPLPGGGGTTASRMTESVRTVTDPEFYDAWFAAVSRELGVPAPRR